MSQCSGKITIVLGALVILGSWIIIAKADTGIVTSNTTTNSQASSSVSSPTNSTTETSANTTSTTTNSSSTVSSKKISHKKSSSSLTASAMFASGNAVTGIAGNAGVASNVQVATVQVEQSSGAANLSIPIQVPPGREGIQPNISLIYSSGFKQLGNAGVGWILDLGSIQISTKKGVPHYDGTDIYTMEQAGSTQDLVADPSTAGLYHMEAEGAFAKIQLFNPNSNSSYWIITDKKGTKYYYGNSSNSIQFDTSNLTHIFRWALNRVEDLNGNYMTISYLIDQGQLYPQTISYTGNDQSSLLLSTYAQVNISYVATSQPTVSYISKFLVETAKRIDHITISVNSNTQSTYIFTYAQSQDTGRDLLKSVQQTGSDGTSTLPPVTFSYSDSQTKGFTHVTNWSVPSGMAFQNSGNTDLGVRLGDFNGDGFPDFIRSMIDGNGISYRAMFIGNKLTGGPNDVKGWTQDNSWNLSNVPYITDQYDELFSGGVDVVDVNSDGLSDVVQAVIDWNSEDGGVTYSPNSAYTTIINSGNKTFVQNNSWTIPNGFINYGSADWGGNSTSIAGGVFADVNGDGYLDFVMSNENLISGEGDKCYSPANYYGTYLNQASLNQTGFISTSNFQVPNNHFSSDSLAESCVDSNGYWQVNFQPNAYPNDLTFGNGFFEGSYPNSATLVDLNGDGLADFIVIQPGTGNALVYINNGQGWVQDTVSAWASSLASIGYIASAEFIDVNGDGLPDLVYLDRNNYLQVAINTGNGFKPQSNWQLTDSLISSQGLQSSQFVDISGNSLPGMLFFDSSSNPKEFANNLTTPIDLLVSINNGIGATTAITYQPSTWFNNTFLPFSFPVVLSTTTTVNSQNYTTTYSYSGGLWDKTYHEFDGFQKVTVTDANNNYVTTTYLQDHWQKGHASETDTYDAKGNLYTKTVNTWQAQTVATNNNFIVGGAAQTSKFLYVSRTDNYLYDGNNSATPKWTAQEFTYGENPQYGDVTQLVNDGQISNSTGLSIDLNKTTTKTSYVYNTTNWIIGLPSVVTTTDINSNVVTKTSFYYDGDTTGSATPSLGKLTAKVNWLGSSTQPDPKTTYTYDGYGNLLTTTDPNLNKTSITYDNTVEMLPVKTTNALNQNVTMTYYGVGSTPLNNGNGLQGLWGQQASTIDANNQTAYSTFDTFGRPVSSISPLDTAALPTETKSYNIQANYIEVTDTARTVSGSATTISTTSFYDGLGRLIETKALGPTAGQFIASGQTVYDNRGLPITKYLPYFTSNNLDTLDSINSSNPNAQATYDAMGRAITKTNPDGSYSSTAYNQWTTTATDENGHMQQSMVDAFGRLVQKQEYLGADGRSSNYPTTSYALYATTSYSYNPRGNLTSVMDAHNNVTSLTYDNLGRKITMNDPDMGNWKYVYDNNSNLIAQEDAKGQVISFTYDTLNRLKSKTDGITGPIVNLPGLALQAPTFTVNYNFDDKTQSYGIGRLGSVTYDTGTAGFVYDKLGREVTSNKTIGGVNYTVTRQYDDLNRLQQLQYPDGRQVVNTFNQAGQAYSVADTGVSSPNTYVKAESYNANGQVTQIQYGSGTTTAYTYDSLLRLKRIYTTNSLNTVLQDLNYTYDSLGQILSIKDNVNTGSALMTQSFTYDALNRLTSANGSYGNKTYAYDSIGNITLKDGLTYSYAQVGSRVGGGNAGPHAVSSLSDGSVFQYDANGNMVSLQKGSNLTQYVYDSQNRLQSVKVGGLTVASYIYDGDGGRTEKTVTRRDLALYNDNTNPLLFNNTVATASNPTSDTTIDVGDLYETESGVSRNSKFIYLGSSRVASLGSDGTLMFYHTDHLGGTNVLSDQTGATRELTTYDPYGQVFVHEKFGNNFNTAWYYFTGKHLDDETGLIFLAARYYNPVLGRFITPDTVVQAPSNPQTLNRYTYCNNNPVNLIDPSGHSWFSKFFKNLFKDLKAIIQTVLDVIAIAVAIIVPTPASPWIIASASLNLFNNGTSSWQGGGWNTIHQAVGYASLACAVVGAYQGFTAASTFKPVAPGDVSPTVPPLSVPDNGLTAVLNNDYSSLGSQLGSAQGLVNSANNSALTWTNDLAVGSESIDWERDVEEAKTLGDVHLANVDYFSEMSNKMPSDDQWYNTMLTKSMSMGGDTTSVARIAVASDNAGKITAVTDVTNNSTGSIYQAGHNVSFAMVCGGGNVNCNGQEDTLWQGTK